MNNKNSNISNSTFKKIRNFLATKSIDKKDIAREKTLPGKTKAFTPSVACFHKNYPQDSKNTLLVVGLGLW